MWTRLCIWALHVHRPEVHARTHVQGSQGEVPRKAMALIIKVYTVNPAYQPFNLLFLKLENTKYNKAKSDPNV